MAETFDPAYIQAASASAKRLMSNIRSIIVIEERRLETLIAALVAGGHVILADTHGVGKTSLARALSESIEWEDFKVSSQGIVVEPFNRIQCTVDLLPQDILGFNRFELSGSDYIFNRGPIFSHFVLCDEINLLTPKTQGSFFQVMEEQRVSIEGKTYEIPDPFFIIATMNLRGQHLFPLPAPQLDRFMVEISLGYPDGPNELEILQRHEREDSWASYKPVVNAAELLAWQKLVDGITINTSVQEYIVSLVRRTRSLPGIVTGASPRAGIKLSRLCRAVALIRGIDFVTVDLVKEFAPAVLSHRLELQDPSADRRAALDQALREVRVPA